MNIRNRVIQVGLGPVGQMLTPFLLERKNLSLVGAVDIDPEKIGKDYHGVTTKKSLEDFAKGTADVVLVTTASKLSAIAPTLETAAKLGFDVVSTCEEMVYPWITQPDLAGRLDRVSKEHEVSFLATGVNPGFLMDIFPLMATAICRDVKKIKVERIQNASLRRIPFQQKIGVGLSLEDFKSRVSQGKLGHVGLTESMHMLATHLGWKLTKTEDKVDPVLAKGKPIGLVQVGRGWVGSDEVLTLYFRAALDEKESFESVHIQGTPEFKTTIPGGIHGDIATCAIVTNAIHAIVNAPSGLRTMADIPPVSFWS